MAEKLKMPTPQEWEAAKDNPEATRILNERADAVIAAAKAKKLNPNPDPNWGEPTPPKPKIKPSPTPKGTQPNHAVTDSKNHTRVVKGD